MRATLLYVIVFIASAVAISQPAFGIYLWTWLSVMSPHTHAWGAASFPFAAVAAGATLLGLVLTRQPRQLPINGVTITLFLFVAWMCFTTLVGIDPEGSFPKLDKVFKIQLMIFVALALIHSRQQINWLIWVLVISLGFYGVKGGIFTILNGGQFKVWGPPGTFIEDNNELALALVMTIPLMRYLQTTVQNKLGRLAFTGAMLATGASVFGSHSRGAFLAITAMSVFLWWRAGRKVGIGLLIVVAGIGAVLLMPSAWEQRMETIKTYDEDLSVQGRFRAWDLARAVAADRVTGGGFDVGTAATYTRYLGDALSTPAAHSIYFQILGEHGYPGLALFILFWLLTWRTAQGVWREGRMREETKWVASLAGMVQASLFAYLLGGAFYSLAYFDLPYNLMIIAMATRRLLDRQRAAANDPSQQDMGKGAIAHAPGA